MLPKPTRVLPPDYTVEPVQDGERRVTLARTGDVSVVEVAYHAVNGASPDFVAFEAAADVLTREPSGRLYKKLVETKLAANVNGGLMAMHDPGLVTFSAEVRNPKNVDKVEAIMLEEIGALGTSKIDDKDLERYRVSTLKEQELLMTNSQRLGLRLAEYIAIGRLARAVRVSRRGEQGDGRGRAARREGVLRAEQPHDRPLRPDQGARARAVHAGREHRGLRQEREGRHRHGGGREVRSQPRQHRRAHAAREIKGGIKTAFLPKKTRGAKVQLELHLHWGDAKSLQNKSTVGSLLGSLMARGTKKKTYQDLQDLEDQLKAHISISTTADGLTLHIDTLRDKLAPAFDLATEMITTPSFPAKELRLHQAEEAQLGAALQDPQSAAFNTYQQMVSPWPKSGPALHELAERGHRGHQEGDRRRDRRVLSRLRGCGPRRARRGRRLQSQGGRGAGREGHDDVGVEEAVRAPREQGVRRAGRAEVIDLKDKENVMIVLGHNLKLRDSDADYPALVVANEVLGSGEGSRLWTRLREREGLSYGVASWVYGGALDEVGGFGGYAIVAPQNLAKAKASLATRSPSSRAAAWSKRPSSRTRRTPGTRSSTRTSATIATCPACSSSSCSTAARWTSRASCARPCKRSPRRTSRGSRSGSSPSAVIVVDAGDQTKAKAGGPPPAAK